MGMYMDLLLRALERNEADTDDRGLIKLRMSCIFLQLILGDKWRDKCVQLNEKPDPWMLNGNDKWLRDHPVAGSDMRRVTYTHRVIRLSDALFTLLGKVDGFEKLRQRFLARDDTQASFMEAEIASLLVYNGCDVKVVGESGVRGEDFDLLATVRGTSVSVEVTAITGGALSVRTVYNKLQGKRNQVPAHRPAVLYVHVPASWMKSHAASFLIFNAAITRFMRRSRRFNIVVLIWEEVVRAAGGGIAHRSVQPIYNNIPRHSIPDRAVFALKPDRFGVRRNAFSFLDRLRAARDKGVALV